MTFFDFRGTISENSGAVASGIGFANRTAHSVLRKGNSARQGDVVVGLRCFSWGSCVIGVERKGAKAGSEISITNCARVVVFVLGVTKAGKQK